MQSPLNNDLVEIAVKLTPFLPSPNLCLSTDPGHPRLSVSAHTEGRVGGRCLTAIAMFMKRVSPSPDLGPLPLIPIHALSTSRTTDGTAQAVPRA